MRFTTVSVALLALAHSLAPAVHGAPAVASDHMNALAVRQTAALPAPLGGLLGTIVALLQGLLAGTVPSATVVKTLQQLESSLAADLPVRAVPSASLLASSASFAPHPSPSTTATASVGLVTGNVSRSSVSLTTTKTSSTTLARMRRQLPTSVLGSISSALPLPSTPGTQSAVQSTSSAPASAPPAASRTAAPPGSAASNPSASANRPTITPTTSHH
ncbi:hypothetical protein OG21DRAFT_3021 [Imleria badia]|nr:hypothetical protein OG21DRAFT_3021 [Imleria badia]